MLIGAGLALVASIATWVVAQTFLMSLARYGERLEAIVSLVAIAVLLLILNWFYHRVYWQENLQDLHRRKRRILAGAGLSLVAAQVVGLVALGFSSVYREGFETVLFLQALTLEAGALTVLQGVALGLAANARGVLPRHRPRAAAAAQEDACRDGRPHHLGARGHGRIDRADASEGRLDRRHADRGLELPYWAGLWFGTYPTWQGLIAQAAALVFVLGSYFTAEHVVRESGSGSRRADRGGRAPIAASSGRAFTQDSSISSAGSESHTMPPPTQRWIRPSATAKVRMVSARSKSPFGQIVPRAPIDAPRPTGSSSAMFADCRDLRRAGDRAAGERRARAAP